MPLPGSKRDRNGISLVNRRFTNCLLVYSTITMMSEGFSCTGFTARWHRGISNGASPNSRNRRLQSSSGLALFACFCLSEERRKKTIGDGTGCLLCQRSVKNTSWMTRCSCSTQSGLHRWVVKRKGNGNRGDTKLFTRRHEIPGRLQIGLGRQTSSKRFVFHW